MLPDEEDMIYEFFPDLVKRCDLRVWLNELPAEDPYLDELRQIKLEDDKNHNNRLILFKMMKSKHPAIFQVLINGLRQRGLTDLADKLEKKPQSAMHKTVIFERPCETVKVQPPPHMANISTEPLKIELEYSTQFYDTDLLCYSTRSRSRGNILIINNVNFADTELYPTRNGAHVDEDNLKTLFEGIGFNLKMYRDLTATEMENVTVEFTAGDSNTPAPDICIFIIMSHAKRVNNQTNIVGSDNRLIREQDITDKFNNLNCPYYKDKPKILIYHVCRGEYVDDLATLRTESDSVLSKESKEPVRVPDGRLVSDMMICHPSLERYKAHRDIFKGCWYIELMCKVFMKNAHNKHIEEMLLEVNEGLKIRLSEGRTQQTATHQNKAFKKCYLHPGIYEENGQIMTFKQSI